MSLNFTSCLTIGFIDYMASQEEEEKTIKSNSGEPYTDFSKSSSTKDGYNIDLYQIDISKYPDSYEYYVRLTCNNSKEYFIWCFYKLNDANNFFYKFQKIEIDYLTWLEEKQSRKEFYRTWASKTELLDNSYIEYWIEPKYNWVEDHLIMTNENYFTNPGSY